MSRRSRRGGRAVAARRSNAMSAIPRGGFNWRIGGTKQSGAGPAVSGASWNDAFTSITNGGILQYQLVSIPTILPSANQTPLLTRLKCVAVQGEVSFINPLVTGVYALAVGVTVVEQTQSAANTWELVDPSSNADAQRDRWFFLRQIALNMATAPTGQAQVTIPFAFNLNVELGDGEALAVVINNNTSSAGTVSVFCSARAATLAAA